MNRTLEELAAALFKSWFVDFDPVVARAEGWQPFGMDAETAALFPAAFEESEAGRCQRGGGLDRSPISLDTSMATTSQRTRQALVAW